MVFTKNKDADRIILEQLDDRDLFQLMLVNKYVYNLADENFWRNRLVSKYPGAAEYKKMQTWKEYYLQVVYYTDLMKRDYNYSYVNGDPKDIYNIFKGDTPSIITFIRHGYEDPALFYVNQRRREFGYPELKPNTPEWQTYIKKLKNF